MKYFSKEMVPDMDMLGSIVKYQILKTPKAPTSDHSTLISTYKPYGHTTSIFVCHILFLHLDE